MPDERDSPSKIPVAEHPAARRHSLESLRTLQLDDAVQSRDELSSALKEVRRPALVVMSGNELGTRKRVSGKIGRAHV